MALDSAAKRQAIPGVGRPWMRGQLPDASLTFAARVSAGNAYPVAQFQDPVPVDTTPDQFTFTDVTGQALGIVISSNTITITGIDSPSPVTFLEIGHLSGEYSLNGGAWTDLANFNIEVSDTLQIRLTSPATHLTTSSIKVTIGGVFDTWDVSTSARGSRHTLSPVDLRVSYSPEDRRESRSPPDRRDSKSG